MPSKHVLGTLWPQVASHLGLSPKDVADDDLKRILQGLYSIGDGVAALRTHAGSAHGHAQGKSYRLAPRHARLAVHAAHKMALFVLETRANFCTMRPRLCSSRHGCQLICSDFEVFKFMKVFFQRHSGPFRPPRVTPGGRWCSGPH